MRGTLSIRTIGLLVIFLILLVLLFPWIGKLGELLEAGGEEQTCEASVIANALPGTYAEGPDFVRFIKCPLMKRTVRGDNEAVIPEVARLMKRCWNIWGSGERKLFRGGHSLCAVCYTLSFTDKKLDVPANDVFDWMSKHFPTGSEKSYAELLAVGGSIPMVHDIKGSEPYGIMTFYSQRRDEAFYVTAFEHPLWHATIFIPGVGWVTRLGTFVAGRATAWLAEQQVIPGVEEPYYTQLVFAPLATITDFAEKANCEAPHTR